MCTLRLGRHSAPPTKTDLAADARPRARGRRWVSHCLFWRCEVTLHIGTALGAGTGSHNLSADGGTTHVHTSARERQKIHVYGRRSGTQPIFGTRSVHVGAPIGRSARQRCRTRRHAPHAPAHVPLPPHRTPRTPPTPWRTARLPCARRPLGARASAVARSETRRAAPPLAAAAARRCTRPSRPPARHAAAPRVATPMEVSRAAVAAFCAILTHDGRRGCVSDRGRDFATAGARGHGR